MLKSGRTTVAGRLVFGLGIAAAAGIASGAAAQPGPEGPKILAPPPPPSAGSEAPNPDMRNLEGTWISTRVVQLGDPSQIGARLSGPGAAEGGNGPAGAAPPPGGFGGPPPPGFAGGPPPGFAGGPPPPGAGGPPPGGPDGGSVPFGPPGMGPPRPFTPKAAARQRYKNEMNAKGTPIAELAARCRPGPSQGIGADLFPAEIIQTADTVVVLQEELRGRWIIHLNAQHPANLTPTYRGHSVGHWEGDTLVVDTIGFNGEMDTVSPKTHITSRLRKIDGGARIELTNVTEDPETYTQPITETIVSRWNPDLQVLEFQCEENLEGALEGLTVEKRE